MYVTKEIPGFPGYYVDVIGNVWSAWHCKGRVKTLGKLKKMKQFRRSKRSPISYLSVTLTKDGMFKLFSVHLLVITTFKGPCPDGLECCHWDGNYQNNRLSNLRWGTKQENAADKERHGRTPRGSKHGIAKLTEEIVLDIRKLHKQGLTYYRLGKRYGVCTNTIKNAVLRITWTHI